MLSNVQRFAVHTFDVACMLVQHSQFTQVVRCVLLIMANHLLGQAGSTLGSIFPLQCIPTFPHMVYTHMDITVMHAAQKLTSKKRSIRFYAVGNHS